MIYRKLALGVAAGFVSISAGQALAQAVTAEPVGALQEIIVTAQKRSENLQDVPIAIAAITSQTLEQSGVTNSDTLNQMVPGLQVGRQIGASQVYLRGVGSQNTSSGDENSIASYVDGVYRISLYSSIQSYNNIERVEVLKGPQGTLFGRNATGGLIHIITKDPSHDASGKVSLSYGNYDTVKAGFYGTMGLTDTLAGDLSVTYSNQDKGYGTNLFTGNDINKTREFATRSKLLWDAHEGTRVIASVDYSDTRSSATIARQLAPGTLGFDGAIIFAGCVAGLGGNPSAPTPAQAGTCAPAAVAGATRNTGNFYNINADSDSYFTAKSYGGQVQVVHEFAGADLVSITSGRKAEALQLLDQDASKLPLILAPLETKVTDFQQELRLESKGSGSIKWIAGLYYLDSTSQYNNFNLTGIGVGGLVPGAIAYRAHPIQKTTSIAGFAQVEFAVNDSTNITVGGRYTRDKREFTSSNQIVFGPGAFFTNVNDFRNATWISIPVNASGALVVQDSKTFSDPTWRLSVDHKLSDDLMVYASYNRGFKSGVYNSANSASPGPVRPEKLDAYEIGFKSEFADRRVRLNGAAFYYNYKDLQLTAIALGATQLLNAATAHNKGAELDVEFAASSHLTLRSGVSLLDAKYSSFPGAPNYTATGIGGNVASTLDAKGKYLSRSPKFTFNAGGNFNVDTGVGQLDIYGNLYYNNGFYWDPQNVIKQDAYTLVNIGSSLGITKKLKITVSIDNLLDKEYSNYGDNGTFGGTIAAAVPRLYRGGFEYSF